MSVLRLVVLGDSIAYGQGAGRAADRPAAVLADRLRSAGHDVTVGVFAVPGARSAALPAQAARAVADRPDIAVIVIGANDLTHLVPPEVAARHLEDAIRSLRAAGSEVVTAPAPDLSALPWAVPPAVRELARSASAELRAAQIAAAVRAGARVADADGATSAAFARDPALFSADRFHPSSAGYRVIAAALAPEVLAAAETCRTRSA